MQWSKVVKSVWHKDEAAISVAGEVNFGTWCGALLPIDKINVEDN